MGYDMLKRDYKTHSSPVQHPYCTPSYLEMVLRHVSWTVGKLNLKFWVMIIYMTIKQTIFNANTHDKRETNIFSEAIGNSCLNISSPFISLPKQYCSFLVCVLHWVLPTFLFTYLFNCRIYYYCRCAKYQLY